MFSYSNWSVLTVNFLVVLYLALGGVTLSAVLHLAGARWRYEIRLLASSLFALFPLAFVLLIVLLANAKATFPWMNITTEHGHVAWHLTSALDGFTFLAWREVIGMLAVMAIHWVFIKRQAVSERSEEDAARFHTIACWVPYAYVLYGTMVAWDFEMFMVPGWQSGIFGMQEFVSFFGMFLSFLVIWIYALNSNGKLVNPVKPFVYNYLAQMMLAFTLLWVYTYFAQYLVLWYGNIPEERDRINWMQDGYYTVIWWAVIALKLVIPFSALAMPFTRHNVKATMAVAVCIIIGTIFERYVWIAGSKIGIDGTYPYLAAIVVSAVVATIGFFLVRMRLHSIQLVKG
jgi:hypothetical protein